MKQLRQQIDIIDEKIQNLLTDRAKLVLDICLEKQTKGVPIYCPEREKEILRKVTKRTQEPLQSNDILKIFETILEVNRNFAIQAAKTKKIEDN